MIVKPNNFLFSHKMIPDYSCAYLSSLAGDDIQNYEREPVLYGQRGARVYVIKVFETGR